MTRPPLGVAAHPDGLIPRSRDSYGEAATGGQTPLILAFVGRARCGGIRPPSGARPRPRAAPRSIAPGAAVALHYELKRLNPYVDLSASDITSRTLNGSRDGRRGVQRGMDMNKMSEPRCKSRLFYRRFLPISAE
jgi:hypothetical protein